MAENYQLSFEDIILQDYVNNQPGRVAYVDECGSFGFDFEKAGTSKYYLLCAIVVENENLEKLHADFEEVKSSNGMANTELKSSSVNDKRRFKIMTQLLLLNFHIVLFIANKEKFIKGSPITEYKPVFIKYMDQHLYNMLYKAYPRLRIIQDETGWPEFQESFKKYVEVHRPQYNLFNQYDFDLVNSKDQVLVQLADFVGGSISKGFLDSNYTNYLEMLRGKITAIEYFPSEHEPYWGKLNPEDCRYDERVFTLAMKSVQDFITKYSDDNTDDRKMQVSVLLYLKMFVLQINPIAFVYSDELVRHLRDNVHIKVTRNTLFRRVIAQLRDEGVILASCNRGYKIPISVEDLMTYLNTSLTTVGPMVHRMGICRNLVKQGTDGALDLFDDPALIRFKRYFDERT